MHCPGVIANKDVELRKLFVNSTKLVLPEKSTKEPGKNFEFPAKFRPPSCRKVQLKKFPEVHSWISQTSIQLSTGNLLRSV